MKSFRFNRAIFSVCAAVLGIVLLIWPAGSLLIIAKCIGVFLAGGGIAAGFMYYRDHDSAMKSVLLILAVVMLICGVVIFLHPEELIKLFPTIVGILVMVSGLINLGETFVLSRSKYGKWWVSLIIAVITIALGVFIVNKAFSLATLITRIAGGVLIFDGVSHLWVISRIYKTSGGAGTTVEGSAVEVNPKTADAGASGAAAAAAGGAADVGQENQNSGAADAGPVSDSTSPAGGAAGVQQAVSNPVEAGAVHTVQPAADSEGAPAPDHTAPVSGQAADEEDGIPEYMKQVEQETDFQQYSDRNPVVIDKPGSDNGKPE